MLEEKEQTKKNKMLKIKQKKWRGWARLFGKFCLVVCAYYVMFGVLFGVARGVGAQDGGLVVFCRMCKGYSEGDAVLIESGELAEFGDLNGGVVAGKVVAIISVRGFLYGANG